MLQYDNSAFYFFALSFLTIYLVPSWYSIISRVFHAFAVSDETIGAVARTSEEKAKAEKIKRESKGFSHLSSKGFLINLAITILLSIVFAYLAVSVSTDGEVNSFDPFSILEIDSGSDAKTIKKAFRTLSLKYHPDKNPNNPAAEARFMMISKAYEALTDEEARANLEKYGNPDGKQSLEVSIGLPSFLLEQKHRNMVLVVYLIVMVILIPFCVWAYYSDSSQFGEKDVMYETYSWFHQLLNEHTITKSIPEIMSGSKEFRKVNMPKSVQEKEFIGQIMNNIRGNMQKPKHNHPVCVKGNVLLHTHLLRKTALFNELKGSKVVKTALQADLRNMLKISNSLIDAMISVCQHQDSLQTAINCIEYGQYLTQAMWVKDSTLLQLPHFTPEEIKHCEKGKVKCYNITQYRNMPDEQKKGMADFTEDQKNDVYQYLKLFPDISVETKVFVDDDEDDKVYEGDLCTVGVEITRNNLDEKEGKLPNKGLVIAPHFPYPKQEAWWIILGTKDGRIISIEKVINPNRVFDHKIKFLAPKKGDYEFDLIVKSNAYVGIDQKTKVKLTTLDPSVLPEYKIHPDDAELDDEPTLFEEILNAHIEQDSDDEDDDSDDDDDDDDDKKEEVDTKENSKKNERLQKARQANDDDSDSDDDDAEEVYADK